MFYFTKQRNMSHDIFAVAKNLLRRLCEYCRSIFQTCPIRTSQLSLVNQCYFLFGYFTSDNLFSPACSGCKYHDIYKASAPRYVVILLNLIGCKFFPRSLPKRSLINWRPRRWSVPHAQSRVLLRLRELARRHHRRLRRRSIRCQSVQHEVKIQSHPVQRMSVKHTNHEKA